MSSRSIVLLACLVAAACSGRGSAPRTIVLITLDTTRADHLGCYGYPNAGTRNLDRIASRAVRFDQAQSVAPITLTAHASMFTGLYPPQHGVRYNGLFKLTEDKVTVAELLRAAGWKTAAVPAAFPVETGTGLAQGFETYRDLFAEAGRDKLAESAARRAESVSAIAIDLVREHAGDRLFLWLHFYDPHDPYEAPEPWASRFPGRPYDAEIAYVDNEVGRILQTLADLGLHDRALVVIAGDHGEGLGDHREPTHRYLVYQSTLRVPLLIKPPGGPRSAVVTEPVSLVDIAPTILDYAGVPAPEGVAGVSLRPAIEGKSVPRRTLYFETVAGSLSFGWAPLYGVRRGPLKFVDAPAPELYDLAADPGETADRAPFDLEAAADLRGELTARRSAWESGGADPAAVADVDAADRAQLESLGYIGGGTTVRATGGRNPREVVHLETPINDGKKLMETGRWPEALALFREVLKEDPDNRLALGRAAQLALEQGDLPFAIGCATRGTTLYPDEAPIWTMLAGARAARGDARGATEALERAVAAGFDDRALVRVSPAFASLRELPAYRLLLP